MSRGYLVDIETEHHQPMDIKGLVVMRCHDCESDAGSFWIRGVPGRHPDVILCLSCFEKWMDDHADTLRL